MNFLYAILDALAFLLHQIIWLYIWVVIVAAVLSWARVDTFNPVMQILLRLTEPVFARLRRLLPTVISGIDLSPVIVILALTTLDRLLAGLML
ncbi:MAG: YggT family protein [Helicobacteraceae bacterium]